jgi:hypothetical protein
VGRDLRVLKSAAGNPSLRATIDAIGWGCAPAQLKRYLDGDRVSLNLERYRDLLRYYFGLSSPSVQAEHPGAYLIDDPVVTWLIRQRGLKNPAQLYEYLGTLHELALHGQLPVQHPAVKLWHYLAGRPRTEPRMSPKSE